MQHEEPVNTAARDLSNDKSEGRRSDELVDDQALVERSKKGDQQAFRVLVERYQGKVYALAFGMLHHRHDALDVSQEAFIKVHRYIGSFQGSASFYTWLYRITYNLCIDHLRRDGRVQSVDYDDRFQRDSSAEVGSLQPDSLGSNPSRIVGRKELAAKIQEAIEDLPPYHRGVIIMREIEGMSYSEMADAMHVSKGTIMSRLHHARHKLQKALAPYLEGELEVR
jgi:RNA polymerase sigma-70 factor (ECF subfamily)